MHLTRIFVGRQPLPDEHLYFGSERGGGREPGSKHDECGDNLATNGVGDTDYASQGHGRVA